ncbi:type II toxin-antitoxin system VapC family toxin [Treponema sp.]|uniref:type II toxin-antitoxin system VapC family toxin n=1 Tax=Treponema sp. TaxID=166 RepID=UPI003FA21B5D
MKFVLVDTSVWSLAFRKKKLTGDDKKVTDYLTFLIRHQYAVMIGPIRQEILSGIPNENKFTELKKALEAFSDFEITRQDYETAAEYYNICRARGIQGLHIDFLICSTAHNNNFSIFTLDKDFENYKKYVDIDLIDIPS